MTISNTLDERAARYGDFTDVARIAQGLQDVMRAADGWGRLNAVQRQSLTAIADKIGRILSGDPNYADNWHDLAGYASLAEQRLTVPEGFKGWSKGRMPRGMRFEQLVELRYVDGGEERCPAEEGDWSQVIAYREVNQ